MNELPEPTGGMHIDQALTLELYHILVENKVITLEYAIKRYKKRAKQFAWGDV